MPRPEVVRQRDELRELAVTSAIGVTVPLIFGELPPSTTPRGEVIGEEPGDRKLSDEDARRVRRRRSDTDGGRFSGGGRL